MPTKTHPFTEPVTPARVQELLIQRVQATATEQHTDLQKAIMKRIGIEDQLKANASDIDRLAKRLADTRAVLELAGRGLQVLKDGATDQQLEIPGLPKSECLHTWTVNAKAQVVCVGCCVPLDEVTRYTLRQPAADAPQSPEPTATGAAGPDEPRVTGPLARAVAGANNRERAKGRGITPDDAQPTRTPSRPRKTAPPVEATESIPA